MFMTTASVPRGWGYRELRVVVGGCYPCMGAPGSSYINNAYLVALSEIEYQATGFGANAVVGLRTIKADESYVLVTGTAIWLDYYPEYGVQYPVVESRLDAPPYPAESRRRFMLDMRW